MYRVCKVLNNNGLIAVNMEDNREFVLMGKGIGFGKKVSERFEEPEGCTKYALLVNSDRGNASELVRNVSPEYLELADYLLREAEREFEIIDWEILFPLADHMAFAAKRLQKGENISNPLTDDIKVLFYKEYKIAFMAKERFQQLDISISDDEIGYIALHIHSAIGKESVSVAMQTANAVRECVARIENETHKKIDICSLDYNRLMNHIKYMVARALNQEVLKLNMNDYIATQYPESYELAATVCQHLGKNIGVTLEKAEVGYLAMHIQRVGF